MSAFIQVFIDQLEQLASYIPLPWFVFLGALIEEIIAPIPSPIVMTLAGSLAASQSAPAIYLLVLGLIGAIGKTLGSYLVYYVADKAEDILLTKFGKLLGVSHKEVESIGRHLNKGRRDDIVLFLLRAIPIVPTAPVSIVCGLIKLNKRTYIVSTFFGTLVRNAIYLYFGYTSIEALESINEGFDSWESLGYVIIALLLALILAYSYMQRGKKNKEHNE